MPRYSLLRPQRSDLSLSIRSSIETSQGACVAALLKIAPVVDRISHRAINLRPVQSQKTEGVGLALQPNLDPIFAKRINTFWPSGLLMDEN